MNEPHDVSARTTQPRVLLWIMIAVLAGILLGGILWASSASRVPIFNGTSYGEPEPAPAFALTNQWRQSSGLADYHGKAVLLFFGFANCPDVCPLTLTRLSAIVETLGRRAEDVQIVLITVDPERDTPEALAEYVERFGPRVVGLTGDDSRLKELRAAYGVYAEKHQGHAGDASVMHTDAVFGIDRRGRLRVLMHADGPEEKLREDIRTLLRL